MQHIGLHAVETEIRRIPGDAACDDGKPAVRIFSPEYLLEEIEIPLAGHPAAGERIADRGNRRRGAGLKFRNGFNRF